MPSWLFHPRIAFLCLTLAKLVATDPETYAGLTVKGFNKLVAFAELFKNRDYDAAILCEKLLPAGLKRLQADPTVDFKPLWKRWNPEGEV
jgi:hypothetical protein